MVRRGLRGGLILTLLLSVVVLASPGTDAAVERSFSDVGGSHPFATEIEWLAGQEITTGYPDGSFRPDGQVTRQAMAAFFQRYSQATTDGPDAGFSDVPGTHPFAGAIWWLADSGITTGYPDGTFKPAGQITRQAMAAFFYRVAGNPDGEDPTCSATEFSDVPVSHPFCGEIAWLASSGITTGFADGTFRPGAAITRQAVAAFFWRYAGSPGPDEPGLNRVDTDEVTILDGDEVSDPVVDGAGGGVRSVRVPSTADVPSAGEKVIMDSTDAVPTGVLGQVTSVTPGPAGTQVVALTPIPISAVVDRWDVSGTTTFDGTAPGAPADGDRTSARSFGDLFDIDCGPSGDFSIDIGLEPTVDIDFHASGGPFEDEVIDLSASAVLDWSFAANVGSSIKCTAEVPFPDPEIRLGAIPLPLGLPPIIPSLEFFVGGSIGDGTSFTVSAGEKDTFTAGVTYVNGVTTPHLGMGQEFSYGGFDTNPIFGKGELFAGARVNLYLAAIAGGYVKVGPYVEGTVQPYENPWWTIDAGGKASFGVGVDLWLVEADINLADLTFAHHHIADSGPAPWPGPTITTTQLPAGSVAEPYAATIDATGGTPPYTWEVTGLPAGLNWDPDTRTISASSAPPANTEVQVTLTDNAGWTAKRSFPLVIESLVNVGGGVGPPDEVQYPTPHTPAWYVHPLPSGRALVHGSPWSGLVDADGTLRWWSTSARGGYGRIEDPAGNLYLVDEVNPGSGPLVVVTSVDQDGVVRWQHSRPSSGYWSTPFGNPRLDQLNGTVSFTSNQYDPGPGFRSHLVTLDAATGEVVADTPLAYVGLEYVAVAGGYLLFNGEACSVLRLDLEGAQVWRYDSGLSYCSGGGGWWAVAPDGGVTVTDLQRSFEGGRPSVPLTRLDPAGDVQWSIDVPTPNGGNGEDCPLRALASGNVLLTCAGGVSGIIAHERSAVDGSVVRSIPDGSGFSLSVVDANGELYGEEAVHLDGDPPNILAGVAIVKFSPSLPTPASSPVRIITEQEATDWAPSSWSGWYNRDLVATGTDKSYVHYCVGIGYLETRCGLRIIDTPGAAPGSAY